MNKVNINKEKMINITELILGMAIKYSEYIHIFTAYYPHTHEFIAYAYPANSNYSDILEKNGDGRLYDNRVFLEEPNCVEHLWDMYLAISNLTNGILPGVANGEGNDER